MTPQEEIDNLKSKIDLYENERIATTDITQRASLLNAITANTNRLNFLEQKQQQQQQQGGKCYYIHIVCIFVCVCFSFVISWCISDDDDDGDDDNRIS